MDGEPRMAILPFTQFLSSVVHVEFNVNIAVCPQRPQGPLGTGSLAQHSHLDCHTAHELWAQSFQFTAALRPHRPQGPLGMGSPGWPPPLSHSSWPLNGKVQCHFTSTETIRAIDPSTGPMQSSISTNQRREMLLFLVWITLVSQTTARHTLTQCGFVIFGSTPHSKMVVWVPTG